MKSLGLIGILFDLDGTLVNSLGDICAGVNAVRVHFSLSQMQEPQIRKFIGKGVDHLILGCFKDILSNHQITEIVKEFLDFYRKHPHISGEAYPGVEKTLLALRAKPNVRLGVVTNKPTDIAEKTLAHYLPSVRFDKIAGPESVSEKKPSPKHLLEVIEPLKLVPSQCWFIGDDPVDLQCARAAKVNFLAATYGFGGVKVPQKQQLHAFSQLLSKIPLE